MDFGITMSSMLQIKFDLYISIDTIHIKINEVTKSFSNWKVEIT
jgi:hypothetical protein